MLGGKNKPAQQRKNMAVTSLEIHREDTRKLEMRTTYSLGQN